jgi:cation diffusion facilitator family transporter
MSTTATHDPAIHPQGEDRSTKRSAALFSVLAALVITTLKLITGILTGSLGMLSEAAHSTIDLVAAAITLFSVQVADRPADDEHNYGHGKIESLSAFVETGLMLASCIWIVTESIRRLFFHAGLAIAVSIWPFLVLLLSITVDFTRARTLHRTAQRFHSIALEADAIHFSTDIWSSTAVLLGLSATWLGERLHIKALEVADPLAALLVAGIILRVTVRLARRTIDNLLDATPTHNADGTPTNTRRDIFRALSAIDGVLSVDRLRIRQSGARFFADITLGMPRNLTFQRTEQVTAAATGAVQRHLPDADVVIHSVPTASKAESLHDRIRAVAARSNLSIHDVTLQQHGDALHLEQHLEVNENMPLRTAHDLVTQLESDIRRDVPEIGSILTHIESEPATIEQPALLDRDREIKRRLRNVAATIPGILDIHDVLVTRLPPAISESGKNLEALIARARSSIHSSVHDEAAVERIQVACHCTLPDDLPMADVHATITALETAFKADSPEVVRLLIHPEPATDNRR